MLTIEINDVGGEGARETQMKHKKGKKTNNTFLWNGNEIRMAF